MASLVADYGESSQESSPSDDSEAESIVERVEETTNERLPPPAFSDKIKNSVFVNPFLEAEIAQYAVLEKHVKMVPQNNCKTVKKICWMFKKGNCRFGKKCKFSHNVDNGQTATNNQDSKDGGVQNQKGAEDEQETDQQSNGECGDEPAKKKKRPGLTQGLIPSKKVLKMYKQQKDK